MKPRVWLPPVVFVAVSMPVVLLLGALEVGGEYRIWIAIGAGALATAFTQSRLARRADEEPDRQP